MKSKKPKPPVNAVEQDPEWVRDRIEELLALGAIRAARRQGTGRKKKDVEKDADGTD